MKEKKEGLVNPISFIDEPKEGLVNPISFIDKSKEDSNKFKAVLVKSNQVNYDDGHVHCENIGQKSTPNSHNVKHSNLPKPITIINEVNERFLINEKGDLCFINEKAISPICNFIISPVKEIIIDNGLNIEKRYLLSGTVNNIKQLPNITITARAFQNSSWIHEKWGLQCKIYAVEKAYELIQEYICGQMINLPQEIQYNHIGWRYIEGKNVYLHGNGAIGTNDPSLRGNQEYVLEINDTLPEPMAFSRLMDMFNIANYHVSIPLLTYTVLGILNKPFQDAGFEPKFLLFLNGTTGSRKTTLAKMFSNIFNRSTDCIPGSFKDTQAALEVKAFEYRDSVLIVDDYHPTTSGVEKRQMETIASYLMRIYGDKIPKSRMNKYMQRQKEFKPQGLCLITGEDIIGGSSTTARYISLEIKEADVNLKKLTEHQQEMTALSTSLTYFIRWVSNNYKPIVEYIKKEYIQLRSIHQNSFSHGRIVESFTLLKMAFDLLIKYGETIGMLSYETSKDWINVANNVFWEITNKHNESMITQDPAIMYLIAIKELIESGKAKILEKDKSTSQNPSVIGYTDSEKLYLLPQIAYNEVKQFWKRQDKEFPLSPQKTNEALDSLGVLEIKHEGNKRVRTVKVSVGKSRSRYLVLDINKINQALADI